MTSPRTFAIDDELAAFLRDPVATVVAARDAHNRPQVVRGYAACLAQDGERLHVHVPTMHASPVLEALADNGQIAVVFSRVHDYLTYQLKGGDAERGPELAVATPDLASYRDGFADALEAVGMARACTDGFAFERYTRVTFTPTSAFVQTPGPNAGLPLGGADE